MSFSKNEITGIILSGGQSFRMGKEKGLCTFKNKPLIAYAIETLKPLCGRLMISANRFTEEYERFHIPVIADEIKNIGPMGGIYTCLKHSQTQHNLILSCDMPFITTDVFSLLLENTQNFQVVCPSHETFLFEPLSAYYNTNILGDLAEAISKKEYKMMRFFQRIRFKSVPVNNRLPFYSENLFLNLNTPEELKKAEESSL